jgi:hypothetical protein
MLRAAGIGLAVVLGGRSAAARVRGCAGALGETGVWVAGVTGLRAVRRRGAVARSRDG